MALGNLQNEADLLRWLEQRARVPGVLPQVSLPFKNMKFGVATCTIFEEGPLYNFKEVAHGLGEEPTGIQLTVVGEGARGGSASVWNYDDSIFVFSCYGALELPGSMTVFWQAVV